MSIDSSGGITSSQEQPDAKFLGFLRKVALVAVMVGAVGSVGLTLRAGQRTPRFLLVFFVVWILSPFLALAWANIVSERWPVLTRATLYCVTLVITLGSLAMYGQFILPPAGSPRAFVFVVVSPASWLLMGTIVPLAAFMSGWLSRRSNTIR